jgi:hypothetical protein
MAKKGRSSLFWQIATKWELFTRCGPEATVGDAFDLALSLLRNDGPHDEYIYHSALIGHILAGTDFSEKPSFVNEFRVGPCRVDVVDLNSTATAYEIKSERDTLVRLARQIEHYQRVFAKVAIVASDRHIDDILRIVPEHIGLMTLSSSDRLTTVRIAMEHYDCICPATVFDAIRLAEAMEILSAFGISAPEAPNMRRYETLRALFKTLEPKSLHIEMVRILKKTRSLVSLNDLVPKTPRSLLAGITSMPLSKRAQGRLLEAIESPLSAAMAWSGKAPIR